MAWADLIIMFDDNGSETSAHFYSDENDGKGRVMNNVLFTNTACTTIKIK